MNSSYSYTYTAQAQPNQPAPTFSVASGQLPPGLNLNPTTGVLSGTITGTGFVPGARVAFGGIYASDVTYKSATTLTATAPAHTPAAVVNVYVLTAAGTSPKGQANTYTYTAPSSHSAAPASHAATRRGRAGLPGRALHTTR